MQEGKENLIIAMLVKTQAEIQATRDTIMCILEEQYKFSDAQIDFFETFYKQKLDDCQKAIIGDIIIKNSKQESIDELLSKLFPKE